MLQSYDDILQALTRALRQAHYYYFMWQDEGHEGAHPECTTFSYDLLHENERRCCACVATPTWWDENGTPRFAAHHPNLCADIYATEVALLRISCQSCGAEYDVQMSWSLAGSILTAARLGSPDVKIADREQRREKFAETSLSAQVRAGTIHYGDPPCDRCAAGATMNCWDLRVLEFWSRDRRLIDAAELLRGGFVDWVRVPDLEIELPDTRDPDRVSRVTP
jgi:hypothetical protein